MNGDLTSEDQLQTNLIASWIIHQLVRACVQRLTGVHGVQNHLVSNHHLQSDGTTRRTLKARPFGATKEANNWVDDGRFFFYFEPGRDPRTFSHRCSTKTPSGIPSPQHHPHHHRRHLPDLKWVINANSLASGCPVAGLGDPPKASDAALFTPPTPPPSHLTALGPRTKADFSGLHPPKTHSVCFLSSLNVTPQAPERIC